MFGGDEDCRVISSTGDFRLLDEPQTDIPGLVQRWFFATACDMSHGDSGAALFDAVTGDVIGLTSSGHDPVNARYNSSKILNSDLLENPEIAWKMNLSIPANKMKTIIKQQISQGKFSDSVSKTLSAILSNQPDKVCF